MHSMSILYVGVYINICASIDKSIYLSIYPSIYLSNLQPRISAGSPLSVPASGIERGTPLGCVGNFSQAVTWKPVKEPGSFGDPFKWDQFTPEMRTKARQLCQDSCCPRQICLNLKRGRS